MINISSIKNIEKILRNELIKQLGLDGKYVLNSLSTHGEDLDKLLEKSIYDSYETSDSVCLFELRSRNDGTNVNYVEENDLITYYKSFDLYVIIYGDDSTDLATKLSARMNSEKVINDLQTKGIYVEKTSDPERINEFKNDVMWIRNDISINISCKLSVSQVTIDHDLELNTLNIINK